MDRYVLASCSLSKCWNCRYLLWQKLFYLSQGHVRHFNLTDDFSIWKGKINHNNHFKIHFSQPNITSWFVLPLCGSSHAPFPAFWIPKPNTWGSSANPSSYSPPTHSLESEIFGLQLQNRFSTYGMMRDSWKINVWSFLTRRVSWILSEDGMLRRVHILEQHGACDNWPPATVSASPRGAGGERRDPRNIRHRKCVIRISGNSVCRKDSTAEKQDAGDKSLWLVTGTCGSVFFIHYSKLSLIVFPYRAQGE